MKYGIVDIGSNTIRLSLFKVTENNLLTELLNKKSTAGLASYVKDGVLSKKGSDKLIKILLKYNRIAQEFGFTELKFFATAILRNIENSAEVLSAVEGRLGKKIDLISAEDEARLGYHGARQRYPDLSGVILDIGGGSTEVSYVEEGELLEAFSISEGALSLHSKFCKSVIPNSEEIKKMQEYVSKTVSDYEIKKSESIYGIGGTNRAVGNICMELKDLNSETYVKTKHIESVFEQLESGDEDTLRTVMQVAPHRLHTIVPGMIILEEVIKMAGAKNMLISKKGIREGYLMNLLNK